MIKCPYCQYENEAGVLFCDQCKSDLGVITEPMPSGSDPSSVIPLAPMAAESAAMAEPVAAPDEIPGLKLPATDEARADTLSRSTDKLPLAPGLPPDANPRLVVIRGVKINTEYPLYEGANFIGRTDERPVDVDLEEQESPDRIWSSRQHACIHLEGGTMTIEDLNSSNGTFVNRTRVHPGERRELYVNDVVQIGTVQLKVQV